MTRPLQRRDISTPIERIVRDWADRNDVSALRYSELTQALVDEISSLIQRAIAQGSQAMVDDLHKALQLQDDPAALADWLRAMVRTANLRKVTS